MARLRWALALLLAGTPLALAQTAYDFNRMFGIPQDASVQATTRSEWKKISSSEIGCIDDALHQQGGSVEDLIQRGVMPPDTRLDEIRSNCRPQLRQQAVSAPVYAVGGLALGERVRFDSLAYKEYKCLPSDQFEGFTWCQKTRTGRERRGSFGASYSILHARDGTAVYINRSQEPAFWAPNEAEEDIQRYSRRIGEQPRIITLPSRPGLPDGILATWGNILLEPLDDESLAKLAQGQRPTTKGYFIDFIGDFARSAKEGLPIYRLGGGAGFAWVASYDQKGRGVLRFLAVNASAIPFQLVATPAPTNPQKERLQGSPSIARSITTDKPGERTAESKASRNPTAPPSLQFLMKGLRIADGFIRLAEETFLAAFNDASSGEALAEDAFTGMNQSSADARDPYQEIAFRNFRQCFLLSDTGCNRAYGILSGIMPTLSPALREVIAQPDPIGEFKYEGACFFSAALDVKTSLLLKGSDGSYRKDQTGHVAYFLNFNGIDPNSIKIIDAQEYIRIAFEPPRSPELGLASSPLWQARYERFISALTEKNPIAKFVILEKREVNEFPGAPVSLLLAGVDESAGDEHDWKPVNYYDEGQPFAIRRSSLKRFPVLAFESEDAEVIAENLNGAIQICQNDNK